MKKTLVIKKVDIASFCKLVFIIDLALVVPLMSVVLLYSAIFQNKGSLATFIVTIILTAIFHPIFVTIVCAMACWVYNLILPLIGGLILEVELKDDSSTEPKT